MNYSSNDGSRAVVIIKDVEPRVQDTDQRAIRLEFELERNISPKKSDRTKT